MPAKKCPFIKNKVSKYYEKFRSILPLEKTFKQLIFLARRLDEVFCSSNESKPFVGLVIEKVVDKNGKNAIETVYVKVIENG